MRRKRYRVISFLTSRSGYMRPLLVLAKVVIALRVSPSKRGDSRKMPSRWEVRPAAAANGQEVSLPPACHWSGHAGARGS